jgi:molybdenum cofactor cytidylyltransferase
MTYTLSQKGMSAIILAAGTSSRMGQAKQLLPLGSSTVLAQTLEHARAAGVDEVILVLGSSAESIRHQLSPSLLAGVKVVVNQSYEQGMATSLHAGLSALDPRSAAALIILGDQPFTLPQTLDRIIQAYRDSGAPIVIPTCQGTRGNPVLLDRSLFSGATALEGDVGCRAIFGNHLEEIVNVEVEDLGVLLDIDDREDYERLAKK